LRARFRPLRSQFVEPTLRLAIRGADRRDQDRFRITGYTVQYDHMHLIVEASDKRALSSGVKSFAIRIARRVNELVGRRGRFWADRWFGRELTSPRQVRRALVYVHANFRKHARRALGPGIDPYSSGRWFDGWELRPAGKGADAGTRADAGKGADVLPESAPVSRPRTWLARAGWRREGLIRLDEAPLGAPRIEQR
jgi:putative transposase